MKIKKYKYLGLVMMLLSFCDVSEVKAYADVASMIEYVQLQNSKEKQNQIKLHVKKVVARDGYSSTNTRTFGPLVLSDFGFLFKWLRELFSSFNLEKVKIKC